MFVVSCAMVLVLLLGTEAVAWGPATHIQLASDLLSNLWMLPAAVGALLVRHRQAFEYGCVATDTVFAKKLSKVKQSCHHWSTGFGLLDSAPSDEATAFAYGYLAHLAADTVAHNKYLPRQMAVSRSTVSFGHHYWELRADSVVMHAHWAALRQTLRGGHPDLEEMLEERLRQTLLSYRTNRVLFKRMNLLASERVWRRSVAFWSRLSRFGLREGLLAGYWAESLDRVADVLSRGRSSSLLYEDPNGNAALDYARAQRKQLRQLKRARIPHAHIIREAAAGHAPTFDGQSARASAACREAESLLASAAADEVTCGCASA